jgi:hypothetical protein
MVTVLKPPPMIMVTVTSEALPEVMITITIPLGPMPAASRPA